MGVMITIEFKRYVVNTQILNIVVGKFSYQKELNLIILSIIDKRSEISLHCIMLLFCLAISLKVKNSRV